MNQRVNVKLSSRALDRIGMNPNTQQSDKPHDVRSAIPMVDYTNPAKFPQHIHRDYPKMALGEGGRPIQIGDSPNELLIFHDEEEEIEFLEDNPELAEAIRTNDPVRKYTNVIEAKDAEIARLRKLAGVKDGDTEIEAEISDEVEEPDSNPLTVATTPVRKPAPVRKASSLPPTLKKTA